MHPHDTHVLPDGSKIRVLNANILVKKDPPPQKDNGGVILFANGAMSHVHGTGTILASGFFTPKDLDHVPLTDVHPDLAVGNKVVFVRFLAEQHTNEQVREMFGDDIIRLQPNDVLLVYAPEDESRLF